MNIFVLSSDPAEAARFHCDRHVVKMVLESAQLLSTALQALGHDGEGLYRPTHANHPCTLWARESLSNYTWLFKLYLHLGDEYTHRYGRTHKSMGLAAKLDPTAHHHLFKSVQRTPFAQAMPVEYQDQSAVEAYRAYYIGEKSSLFSFTNREIPQPFRKENSQ